MLEAARRTPAGLAYLASRAQFSLPPHLRLLDDRLRALADGLISRLMVMMPPRHGKSWLASQYFPAWYVGARRGRIILSSYEATFAASWGRLARDVIGEWGPALWPEWARVSETSAARNWWELEGAGGEHGVMMTAGAGGALTGKGGDLICDDPVKNAQEANSEVMREALWQWYVTTFRTRLRPGGFILLIQTRWHDDDLAGRLLKQMERGEGEEWHVLKLPAIAEQDEEIPLLCNPNLPPFRRKAGEPLWPEMFDLATLAQTKAAVTYEQGGDAWPALYQQTPTLGSGAVWRREWFGEGRRYSYARMLAAKRDGKLRSELGIRRIGQSVDSAWKEGVHNDFSVIATWGVTDTDFLLLDVWRERVEYPKLKAAIADAAAKWHPAAIWIEDRASGTAAIQELRHSTRLPILAYDPGGTSKVARAQLVTPLAEAGHVKLPDSGAEWLADWIEEHVRFPKAAHDDQVDTSSMALAMLRDHGSRVLRTS